MAAAPAVAAAIASAALGAPWAADLQGGSLSPAAPAAAAGRQRLMSSPGANGSSAPARRLRGRRTPPGAPRWVVAAGASALRAEMACLAAVAQLVSIVAIL